APAEAATLDVEVVVLREADDVVALLERLSAEVGPYAIEARWDAVPPGGLRALAFADHTGGAWYVDGDVLRDPRVSPAIGSLSAEGGPPLVAHRAKELMHGLARDIRSLRDDTAVMAYLLDPGEGRYLLEDLALRYLALEVTSPDGDPGTLD